MAPSCVLAHCAVRALYATLERRYDERERRDPVGDIIDLEELPITDSIDFLRDRMLNAPVPLALEPHAHAE